MSIPYKLYALNFRFFKDPFILLQFERVVLLFSYFLQIIYDIKSYVDSSYFG